MYFSCAVGSEEELNGAPKAEGFRVMRPRKFLHFRGTEMLFPLILRFEERFYESKLKLSISLVISAARQWTSAKLLIQYKL